MVPIIIGWVLGGPVTYALLVAHTWQGGASIFVKLLINVTLDAALAAIWPITWGLWVVFHLLGQDTPLRMLFG